MIVAMDELLRIHTLTVELPTTAGWVRPVNEVTLHIAPGEALGLVGESGSGKTMLSLALMGLLPPGARVSGEAFLSAANGQHKTLANLSEPQWREVRGREIAMIFQEPMTSLNPVLRIGTQIEEAIWAHEPGFAAQRYCSSGDGRSGASSCARTRFQSLLKSTEFCGPQ
jgi:ABC-type glutathione transport system ATPase component